MSLPGLNPSIAANAMEQLIQGWVELMMNMPVNENSNPESDSHILAILLIAHENAELIKGTCKTEIDYCLSIAGSSPWPQLDQLPWLLIKEYTTYGFAGGGSIRRVERLLSNPRSSIRYWFHKVAWMVRSNLDRDDVTPRLLQNLAENLGAVTESVGLLSSLYAEKAELDSLADAFEPENGFEEQYRDRLQHVRKNNWNLFQFPLVAEENKCRQLAWDAVKSLEMVK